jgi:hypothetical protein
VVLGDHEEIPESDDDCSRGDYKASFDSPVVVINQVRLVHKQEQHVNSGLGKIL